MITKTQQLVLKGYKAGLTPKEIARRIGSTRCSVSVIAHRLGVTRSHQERWKMVRGF
jgi:transcriptional regulator